MSKALMVAVPVILVALVAGLGFSGVVNIPGLTPAKAKKPPSNYGEKDDKLAAKADATKAAPGSKKEEPAKPKPKPAVAKDTKDPEKGAAALADVWNAIDTPNLVAISKTWKDPDLVRVLNHMDTDKVAQFLELLATGNPETKLKADPERASKLSKVLQDQGSLIKAQQTT